MMGSATAMLTAVMQQAASPAGQGEADATDGADFLAALDATLPCGSAPTGKTTCPAASLTDDGGAGTAPPDVAAVLAAMLQSALPTAAAAAAVANASAQPDAGGQVAGATRPGATAGGASERSLLANLQAAAADAAASDAADVQDIAAAANPATDAAQKSPPPSGLRQILQWLAPAQSSTPPGDATFDKPGIKQAQVVGQTPAAAAASIALTGNVPEIAATAAAAATPQLELSHTNSQPPVPAATSTQATDASLAAANLSVPAHQTQAAAVAPDQTLHAAVGTPRWADELGSRLVLMNLTGQHEGSLNLIPEHLGPLEVRISVNHDTANVWFGAQHADTRAALTEALPRLRELLAGAGLTLGQSGVSQQAPRQGARAGGSPRVDAVQAVGAVDAPDSAARPAARGVALGLVDTYA
jgi:flagellar hook-length control protein FliK